MDNFFKICKASLWLPQDIEIHKDVIDIRCKLSLAEKHLLNYCFRYFLEKPSSLPRKYQEEIPEEEQFFILNAFFSCKEIESYQYLIRNFQIPNIEHRILQEFKEIHYKNNFLTNDSLHCNYAIAKNLAFSAIFRESLQYHTAFIVLLNFQRHDTMRGLSQILSLILKDKNQSAGEYLRIYRKFKNHIFILDELNEDIYDSIQKIISQEFHFIDTLFGDIQLQNLTTHQLKNYVLWKISENLKKIGIEKPIPLAPKKNPIEWFDSESFEAPITQCINEENNE
jgi:ribonucleotide reductase beta subunit family protein with ferritin-like domain